MDDDGAPPNDELTSADVAALADLRQKVEEATRDLEYANLLVARRDEEIGQLREEIAKRAAPQTHQCSRCQQEATWSHIPTGAKFCATHASGAILSVAHENPYHER